MDLGRLKDDSLNFCFKIMSSLEKVEMELAKGNLITSLEEINGNYNNFITINLMSSAIPDQISKKEKPKVVKSKVFKEDNLKKIETETLIGELHLQIIEENEQISKNQPTPSIYRSENENPIYYLFLNIDKISNVK